MMAEAAAYNIDRGAQIIDINMGCPAKKVCTKWAGSALMQDEAAGVADRGSRGGRRCAARRAGHAEDAHRLVQRRTQRRGASPARPNSAGIAMVTVHGRTREQGYSGHAEYDTIAAVKAALRIPVVANGDIDSPEKARLVLDRTGADALMIGRAAQGRPWIFREIGHFLETGEHLPAPETAEAKAWLLEHLHGPLRLYGEYTGVRTARKHIGWAVRALPGGEDFRHFMNTLETCDDAGAGRDRLVRRTGRPPPPPAHHRGRR